jgi:hypothetical protein
MPGAHLIVALALAGFALAVWHALGWRALAAKRLYLSQCDAALRYPQFANPEGRLDLRSKTVDGDKTAFEQYEWYVARLVYVLDECLTLTRAKRWRAVADTQLGVHKHYFASDYYRKQDYLPHYSARMRALIREQQGEAA